jgi:hypothetical protein
MASGGCDVDGVAHFLCREFLRAEGAFERRHDVLNTGPEKEMDSTSMRSGVTAGSRLPSALVWLLHVRSTC